jgi:hypothetical protein
VVALGEANTAPKINLSSYLKHHTLDSCAQSPRHAPLYNPRQQNKPYKNRMLTDNVTARLLPLRRFFESIVAEVPWQQFINAVDGVICHGVKGSSQVCLGIDAVEFCNFQQRICGGCVFTAFV